MVVRKRQNGIEKPHGRVQSKPVVNSLKDYGIVEIDHNKENDYHWVHRRLGSCDLVIVILETCSSWVLGDWRREVAAMDVVVSIHTTWQCIGLPSSQWFKSERKPPSSPAH